MAAGGEAAQSVANAADGNAVCPGQRVHGHSPSSTRARRSFRRARSSTRSIGLADDYPESAYGYARTGQTLVNAPDGTLIRFYVDDEPFDVARATLVNYERTLDMRTGILERDVTWEKGSGKQIRIRSRRLVSFEHRHVAAVSYDVTLLNANAPVVISSELVHRTETRPAEGDPRGARAFSAPVLLPQGLHANGGRVILTAMTRTSRMTLACGMDHRIEAVRLIRSPELIVGGAGPSRHLVQRCRGTDDTGHQAADVPHVTARPGRRVAGAGGSSPGWRERPRFRGAGGRSTDSAGQVLGSGGYRSAGQR